jgi:hypothetical protein
VTLWLSVPVEPVTTGAIVPVTPLGRVRVSVAVPGGVILDGLKIAVAPVGRDEGATDKATDPLNAGVEVSVI